MHFHLFARSTTAIACALVSSVAASASFDPLGWYYDEDHAGWTCRSMVDLDQRRATSKTTPGLSDDGRKHCGPAATANLLCWFANNGDPSLPPGPGDWQSDAFYDDATTLIDELGEEMDCCGVGPNRGHAAIVDRLDPDKYTVVTRVLDDDEAPNFQNLLEASLGGGMSIFAYGRYDDTGETHEGVTIREIDGGHMVTLQDIRINGDDRRIRARNPFTGDSDNHFSQSTFSSKEYFPAEHTFYKRMDDGELKGPYTLTQLPYTPGGSSTKHIDWTTTIYPAWGLTMINLELHVMNADDDEPYSIGVPPDPKFNPTDYELVGTRQWLWLLRETVDESKLQRVHLPSGNMLDMKEIGLQSPREIAMDDRGSLWVLDGQSVVRLDALETTPRIAFQEELPFPVRSLAWDGGKRAMVALSEDGSEVLILKLIEYGFIMDHLPIPEGSQPGPKARLAAHPDGSGWWIADPDSGLSFLMGEPDQPIHHLEHPDLEMPTDVQVTDAGTLLVADGGAWLAFSRDAKGQWNRHDSHFLDGQVAGDRIMVSRNRNNWNAEYHEGFTWKLVSPPEDGGEVADCIADINLDQVVDVTDLLVLLSDWDRMASPSDLDGDGKVNVTDLLKIIESWGECPGA